MTGILFDSRDSGGGGGGVSLEKWPVSLGIASGDRICFQAPNPESLESNSIQIMTDHEGNRKIYLARGIQEGLDTADYCLRRSRG